MPHIVNGIGTWYYGKANLRKREGQCSQCGKAATLSSYDTRLFFVFLMIPIIPLTRKHIIDHCPHCSSHRSLPMDEWAKITKEATGSATEEFRRNPEDPAKAKSAIGAFAGLMDYEGLRSFEPELTSHYGQNAEVMVVLGNAYFYLSRLEDAERAYRRGTVADPEDMDAREGLAQVLIRQGRPQDAAPLIAHVIHRCEPDKVWLLYQLAGAWQAQGKHEEALRLFDQSLAILPQLKDNKDFKKSRKLSEKYRGTDKVIKSRKPKAITHGEREGTSLGGRIAVLVLPAILLVVAIAYGWSAYSIGQHREIHLVNGLTKPYDVLINGSQKVTLRPGRAMLVEVPEGEIQFQPSYPGLEPFTETISTSFLSRPLSDDTFVVNPDKVAVVHVQRAYYAENDNGQEQEHFVSVGESLHKASDIDFVFQPMPSTIKAEANKVHERTGISTFALPDAVMGSVERHALMECDAQRVVSAIIRRAQLEGVDDQALFLLPMLANADQVRQQMEPLLSAVPYRIEAHRVWQGMLDSEGREEEVIREYRDRLAASPDDPALQYLLGRVLDDPDEAAELFRKAVNAANPSGHACYALAYSHYCNGELDQAVPLSRRAMELAPGHLQMANVHLDILLAAGQYDEAIEFIAKSGLPEDPMQNGMVLLKVDALAAKGDDAGATALIERIARQLTINYGEESGNSVKRMAMIRAAVAKGQAEQYYAAAAGEGLVPDPIIPLLFGDKLDDALKAVDPDETSPEAESLLAVACYRAGRAADAAPVLEMIKTQLGTSGGDIKHFTRAIAGDSTLAPEKLLRLSVLPDTKLPLLMLLAELQPEHRELYLAKARQINYVKLWATPLVNRLLEQ